MNGVALTDMVDNSVIASRLGVTRGAVSNWVVRHPDFSRPLNITGVSTPCGHGTP